MDTSNREGCVFQQNPDYLPPGGPPPEADPRAIADLLQIVLGPTLQLLMCVWPATLAAGLYVSSLELCFGSLGLLFLNGGALARLYYSPPDQDGFNPIG